jgi:hypothetical protein
MVFFFYILKNILLFWEIFRYQDSSDGILGGENFKKKKKKFFRKESEEMKRLKITNGVDFLSFLK